MATGIARTVQSDIGTELRAKIAALGPTFNPEVLAATRALYQPLVERQSRVKVKVTPDIQYGDDERQKLDVYRGEGAQMPVLVYIPGGGFVGGDKNADGVFYPNLGVYFANHGILTVVVNYRLAPKHVFPAGAQDVASALAWCKASAVSHGGNPERIFLVGQSAGASHVATYLFDPAFHGSGDAGVRAAILMSGVYRIATPNPGANAVAYYGSDPSLYEARSPITHARRSRVPLMLSCAEYDPPALSAPTFELAQAVTLRDGRSPFFAWQQGHNHVSTVMSLGSGQDDVGERIREFIARF
jgi:acetyl esterase/lipase